MDTNKVELAGRLGKEPNIKYTGSGKAVCNFTVATSYKGQTTWHDCVAWEKQAEQFQGVRKGTVVELKGRLQTRTWEKDGVKHYKTEVVAYELTVGGQHGNSSTGNAGNPDADDPFDQ